MQERMTEQSTNVLELTSGIASLVETKLEAKSSRGNKAGYRNACALNHSENGRVILQRMPEKAVS